MPITKDFKTIDDQISGLKQRGLKFKTNNAYTILKKYNYFDVINGFETLLLKPNTLKKTYENIYFEDFSELFFFDMKLKKITLFKIFDIESRLRTSIAYHFSAQYCQGSANIMNYLDKQYYKAPDPSDTHMNNVFNSFDLFKQTTYWPNGQIRSRSFIDELKLNKDYLKQYKNPPFWVTVKALPLGSLYYTFVFLDDVVKEKVLNDFNLTLNDSTAFEQALYILKEMRNQCAHLELITRFSLKKTIKLNRFNDITIKSKLSLGNKIVYLDVLKIFKLFGSIKDIKFLIIRFYLKMFLKGRKKVVDKLLSKMGRKSIKVWMQL